MIRKFVNTCLLIIVVSFILAGCASKKHIGDNQYFVNKYKVSVDNKPEEIDINDLKSLFRPKANSKFMGVRWKVSHYYKRERNPSKYNKWSYKNFGEEPNLYDEEIPTRIAYKMRKYLDNIGFFNSKVTFNAKLENKTADITFLVEPAPPYYISQISYDIADSTLNSFFRKDIKKTLIKKGDIYNAYTFDDERDRITNQLRDDGYFYFNRNYIQFIVDSSFLKHELTVVLKINNVQKQTPGSPGELSEENHTRYYIKEVDIIPDWKPNVEQKFDTVKHPIYFWHQDQDYVYNFLLDEKKRIKPKAFNTSISIKPNTPYSAADLQSTYRRLFNFRIIRTATISFDTTGAGESEDGSYKYINSRIQMQTAKLNSFQVEAVGTNSNSDLGVRGSVVFANKNIFKMGDVLSLRVNGGFEAQSVTSDVEGANENGVFNTFEAGASGNIYFPRFLSPIKLSKFNQRYHPITNINFGFTYQKRPNYDRNISNFDIGYSWYQNPKIKHIVTPLNINYVNIFPSESMKEDLEDEPNQRLKEQYSDHMVLGLSYSFIFNNQNLKSLDHFDYFRLNFESSGNLLYAIDEWSNAIRYEESDTTQGYYKFLGVRYAQYIRISTDYRHYYYFANKSNGLVFRFLAGVAVPFGNSSEITYEKGFYGGGANDMRGWRFRTLGPGGFAGFSETNDGDYERIGEIQLELNTEYRFPVYDWIKGAFFVDIGNIWLLNTSDTYPNGEFNWDTWYRQLAVNVGVGVRFDFSFFIFRIDMATPIRQPSLYETGDMWVSPTTYIFNFGIGYPF